MAAIVLFCAALLVCVVLKVAEDSIHYGDSKNNQ